MLSERITIVIPTKDEQGYIGRLLHDIIQQYDITGTRVIVADSSTDATPEIVNEFASEHSDKIKLELIEGGPVSIARNAGALLVKTPFILFLDADVRLINPYHIIDAFLKLKGLSSRYGKGLVTSRLGSYSNDWKCGFAYTVYNWVHSVLVKRYPFAIGGFFFVDTTSFTKFGMFDRSTDNSEDFLFSQNYEPKQFGICSYKILLDDRRFKKIGYFNTVKHLLWNFINFLFKNKTHFTRRSSYWGT